MRSFSIIGDVDVCSLVGSQLQGNFRAGLSRNASPRIFEGAPLAGISVERALQALDGNDDFRVCRPLTPMELKSPIDGRDEKATYPYGSYVNFPESSDPMREPSAERTLAPVSLTADDKDARLRLTTATRLTANPQPVYSPQMLDSLKPGGVFEYSAAGRLLRDQVFFACQEWITYSFLASRSHSQKSQHSATFSKWQTKNKQDTVSRLNTIATWVDDHGKGLSDDVVRDFVRYKETALKMLESGKELTQDFFKTLTRQYITLLNDEQRASRDEDPLQAIPDVVVLYDLYNSSPVDAGKSCHAASGSHEDLPRTYMRNVRVPSDLDIKQQYGEHSDHIKSRLDDLVTIAKSWHRFAYGILAAIARRMENEWNKETRSADRASSLGAIVDISRVYGEGMIGEQFVRDAHIDVNVAQRTWSEYLDRFAGNPESQEADDGRSDLFDAVARLTLARVHLAESVTRTKLPAAEPVVVCCIKSLDLPTLSLEDDGSGSVDYLTSLYRDRWLRSRTVLILDADYLRRLLENPAGISSESSWEETVLDTIDAFQRRERLRPYLEFGFLVIRYGVSGALLISKQPSGELSTRLFFDPNKNDRSWTKNKDGEVIGYTSIFAASIVQSIVISCQRRGNETVYSDVREALHDGIGRALTRCQQACAYAYGRASGERDAHPSRSHAFEDLICNRGIPPGLYELQYKSQMYLNDWANAVPNGRDKSYREAVHHDFTAVCRDVAPLISSSTVPTVRNLKWSILEQSCSSDLEKVAFTIACKGVDSALNQHGRTIDDFVANSAEFVYDHFVLHTQAAEELVAERVRQLSDIEGILAEKKEELSAYEKKNASEQVETEINVLREAVEAAQRVRDEHDAEVEKCLTTVRTVWVSEIKKGLGELMKKQRGFKKLTVRESRCLANCETEVSRLCDELLWRVKKQLTVGEAEFKGLARNVSNATIACKIFDFGALEQFSMYSAPVARFGKAKSEITAIDRREVEGIAAIHRLIAHYVDSGESRPLSIAVFGPPGSGKSTAVKKIAESFGNKIDYRDLEFNLSQFTKVEELAEAFQEVQAKKGSCPLVFFDEFDCKFENNDFGWLKYFLAPMEDGKFGKSKRLGPAILIFAGGTSFSFNAFSPKGPSPNDERTVNFSRAKGPDFISRLSGHLNVIGIDPTDPEDGLYLLRRAVLIREFLTLNKAVDSGGAAKVDDHRVLQAILHAPSYRYGGRSLRMLINACMGADGFLRRCNIPATHELDMMVDSKSFLAMLRDSLK